MNMMQKHFPAAVLGFWMSAALGLAAAAGPSLLSNGDFETAGANAGAADWPGPSAGVSWEQEEGNHFLRLKSPRPGQMIVVYRVVELPAGEQAFRLSLRTRYTRIIHGKENWHDARIMMNFLDGAGRKLGSPAPPHWTGSASDWRAHTQEFLAPQGAAKLEIMLALFQVQSGTIDFDDISLEAIPPGAALEKKKAADAVLAAEAARQAAAVKAQAPVVPPDKMPPALHVAGNQIQQAGGKPVWLQGVAIPSLEWSESGEQILRSVSVAIQDWKATCVRLPVSRTFWFGRGPHRHDGGRGYQQLVDDAVNLCAASGVYLVLDLHGFKAPAEEDLLFWQDAARHFKNNPAVVFELFNEPHDISWETWRNGGPVTESKASGDKTPQTRQSVGMQRLLEAVRQTGAKNMVIAGGLDWGYDLSGVVRGHALEDKQGNGVVYSSHIYPWKARWQANVLDAAAKFPIFVGEVGVPPDYAKFSFIPKSGQFPLEGWAPDVLGLIQKHKLNWTAWSFHHQAGPCALADLKTYTPTPYWGQFVRDALAGKQFELKKMR